MTSVWERWGAACAASEEAVEVEVVPLPCEGVKKALILRKLVPREVCAALCSTMDAALTTDSAAEGFRSAVRRSDNWATDAPEFMEALWARCGAILRDELGDVHLGPELRGFGVPASAHGTWSVSGLSSRVGIFRYGEGGHFAPHYDGTYRPAGDTETESQFTMVLYLHDGDAPEGGGTLLLSDKAKIMRSEPRIFAEDGLVRRVAPCAGTALIFQQRLVLHAGELVTVGRKYILRSDVLCRRTVRPERTAAQERCLEKIREAQELEAARKYDEALEAYRTAERIDRDLFRSELH